MATDLPVKQDLTFIFERDDVKEAIYGHCWTTHPDLANDPGHERRCDACLHLIAVLADAIGVWQTMVEQEQAVAAVARGSASQHEPPTRV